MTYELHEKQPVNETISGTRYLVPLSPLASSAYSPDALLGFEQGAATWIADDLHLAY